MSLAQDTRYALRVLARAPGFTAAVVLTLALGVAATTAVFSVFNAVLLRPFSYPAPDRLVMIGDPDQRTRNVSYQDYMDFVAQSGAFSRAAVFNEWSPSISGAGEAEMLRGGIVDSPFFEVFGVKPERGRFFSAEEDRPGKDDTVVISHGLWMRKFGGADVVGKPLTVDGRPLTIIGITPASFEDPHLVSGHDGEIWTTIAPKFDGDWVRSGRSLRMVARLRAGVTLAEAKARVEAISARLQTLYPKDNVSEDYSLIGLRQARLGDVRRPMILVFAASALLLLIACANVVNLMLARTARRTAETSVRVALGASPWHILRQLAAEAFVLALLGGVGGVALANGLVALFVRLGGESVPRMLQVSLDARVLLFAMAATLLTAFVTALLPGLQAVRGRVSGPRSTRGASAGAGVQRSQAVLVVAQVAVSVLVIAVAALLGRSLWNLLHVDKGFDEHAALTMKVRAPRDAYPKQENVAVFYAEVLRQIRALPGVEVAGTASMLPFDGNWSCDGFALPDHPELDPSRPCAESRVVSSGYLASIGAPILRGRGITEADGKDAPKVALLDAAFARKYFGDADPLGRIVEIHEAKRTIVGITAPARLLQVSDPSNPVIYTPEVQDDRAYRARSLIIRTSADPLALAGPVRRIVSGISPAAPVAEVRTMRNVIDTSLAPQRFRAVLVGGFAAAALLLATIGVAGVLSFATSQRLREIGIRLACGATPSRIARLILRRAFQLLAAGSILGVIGAAVAGRFVEALLFGVHATDPLTLVAVVVTLSAAGLAAGALPAMRAASVEPVEVLRAE
jgi:predicted permease